MVSGSSHDHYHLSLCNSHSDLELLRHLQLPPLPPFILLSSGVPNFYEVEPVSSQLIPSISYRVRNVRDVLLKW
jgi:hypothetical protein